MVVPQRKQYSQDKCYVFPNSNHVDVLLGWEDIKSENLLEPIREIVDPLTEHAQNGMLEHLLALGFRKRRKC